MYESILSVRNRNCSNDRPPREATNSLQSVLANRGPMNTELVKIGVCVAAILAVGLIAWSSGEQMHFLGRTPEATAASQTSLSMAASKDIEPDRPTAVGETNEKIMDAATSFGALRNLVEAHVRDEGARIEYLRQAAILCEGFIANNQRATSGSRSASLYSDYVDRFCSDFTGSSDAYLQALYSAPSDSDVTQALALNSLAVDESGKALATARAMELVANSEEPLAVQAVARFLGGESVRMFGDNFAESGADYGEIQKAQLLAASMLSCDLGGGCGSEGYYTMIECAAANACQPNITLDQVWRQTHSPKSYALARRIYQGILEMRSKR